MRLYWRYVCAPAKDCHLPSDSALLSPLFEDADLLVVNKPAGLVCHPSKDGPLSSLIGRVRLHLGHTEGRLVNRLDRETSGVVLIAKSAAVAGELGRIIAGPVTKTYWAIVDGHVPDAPLVIEAPLGKDAASPVAIRDCVRQDGAAARTDARVLRTFARDGAVFSVLDVQPQSGRKHQIRIHLAHAGYPIVGDKLYGPDPLRYLRLVEGRLTGEDRRALRLTHQALHARAIAFHWRGQPWRFEAAADEAFLAFVRGGQDVRIFDRAFMT